MYKHTKLVRSLCFAAVIPLVGPLNAVAAEALPNPITTTSPQNMQACSSVGFGFIVIPGTQTCLKINMSILYESKLDLVQNDLSIQTLRLPTLAFPNGSVPVIEYSKQNFFKTADHFVPRESLQFGVTTVTPTDFGPLIAYGNFRNFPALTLSNQRLRLTPTDVLQIDQAWVNFAGFTAGMHRSFFDFTQPGYGYFGGYSSIVNLNMLAYTRTFGNIASATLSLEDNASRRQEDGILSGLETQSQPDIVGQLRVAPSWATFQIAAALHKITDGTAYNCCNASIHT